jgi:hypothetical protein
LNCGTNATKDNWIVSPTGFTLTETPNTYTADPLVGTSEVLGQTSRLTSVAAITSPSLTFTGAGATNLAFSSSSNASIISALTAQGCTGSVCIVRLDDYLHRWHP